ncbi:hypothetical protein SmJEL517_g04786 [Synchytrium microbalum]|uniref:Mitochondrial import receptor subunit Tom22 n=1 Tax=Synchytrium microbalum TaxID=1806994 RepID=A0A507C282_9FUNG|nr:uncharacterized protein SmJEL517_g04786 [Synchytrium microbalum]TPX32066.1 hypothetical protein SmJEL517_g04786 [Synchytrium microbalum]
MPEIHEVSGAEEEDVQSEEDLLDDDEFETDSEADSISEEGILDRLLALEDAIPQSVKSAFSTSLSFSLAGLRWAGSGLWILSTAAMLLALPVALEGEKEQAAIQQEQMAKTASSVPMAPPSAL